MAIYELPIQKLSDGTSRIISEIKPTVCEFKTQDSFYWFFLPIIIILLLILIIKFRKLIKFLVISKLAKRGYIRINYIMPNKRIVSKLKKLDKFNTFKFQKRRYVLEKMHDFIIGYDKYGLPIFMYDNNFIIPMKITERNINEQLRESLKDSGVEISDDLISEFTLKIQPSIFQIVYDKKLVSDLYSLSSGDEFKKTIMYIVIGFIILIVLYYTGLLAEILSFFGINMVNAGN